MHYPPFGVLANVLVQSHKLEEAAGWAAILGKYLVQSQNAGKDVRRAGLRPMHGAHRPHQERLPLSPDSEKRFAQGVECSAARHVGATLRKPASRAAI